MSSTSAPRDMSAAGRERPKQDLAVYMSATNVLNELGPDISAVEFRKDKHICLPANRAWSHLALSDLGNECRVSLHLAVHSDFHPEPVRELAHNGDGACHLFGGGGFRAALGGKA